MKKSLIALAALAASGFAMAQSSVTLFGTVDTNVTYVDGKQSATVMSNSGIGSSAFGLRGVEDLGNGLKAGFHIEAGINSDTGDGWAGGASQNGGLEFKRRSTLSLMGGFGELRLGRDLTVGYSAASKYDAFGTLGIGSSRLWGADVGFNDVRRSNMISYFSPSFGGFKVNAGYAMGEQIGGDNRSGDTASLAATYDNGPLSLGLGYQETARSTYRGDEEKFWAVGGSYDFGVVKLSAAYTSVNDKSKGAEVVPRSNKESSNYTIGLTAPVGAAGIVKVSYNRYDLDNKGVTPNTSAKANHYSLGYVHTLSKRTAAYGTYSYLKNNNRGSQFGLNTANGQGTALATSNLDNGKVQAIQVGIRHSF